MALQINTNTPPRPPLRPKKSMPPLLLYAGVALIAAGGIAFLWMASTRIPNRYANYTTGLGLSIVGAALVALHFGTRRA